VEISKFVHGMIHVIFFIAISKLVKVYIFEKEVEMIPKK
jgi:hypothetical protein